ncbi:MAG: fuculose phosphate aldolase [Dehalococcoidia bacterium]|jgi:L-fuculose-phosphate aldolase|nr:MAG: fuculose phosphate aldolase [Dehalococcoidia bacterium]
MLLAQFQTTGRDLFNLGLAASGTGNLSVRLGERIIITRRGCSLNCLEEPDLIETGLERNDRATPLASTELSVHRAIYLATRASAIVHAHPPHATALSLAACEIVPADSEGYATIGTVPVLSQETRPEALAREIARALTDHRIVTVSGHGSYATGQLLEEALSYTTLLEASARINCLLRSLKVGSYPQV